MKSVQSCSVRSIDTTEVALAAELRRAVFCPPKASMMVVSISSSRRLSGAASALCCCKCVAVVERRHDSIVLHASSKFSGSVSSSE